MKNFVRATAVAVCAGAAAAVLPASPANAFEINIGSWNAFHGIQSNWSCRPTVTVSSAGTQWYSQYCKVTSGNYVQAAIIVRRAKTRGPSYMVSAGSSITVGRSGSLIRTCEGTQGGTFYPGDVKVCFSKTYAVANQGPVVGGGAHTGRHYFGPQGSLVAAQGFMR